MTTYTRADWAHAYELADSIPEEAIPNNGNWERYCIEPRDSIATVILFAESTIRQNLLAHVATQVRALDHEATCCTHTNGTYCTNTTDIYCGQSHGYTVISNGWTPPTVTRNPCDKVCRCLISQVLQIINQEVTR